MKQRCLNPTDSNYPYYGGRGIKVCDDWLNFENFYKDMGERPEGKTLDRIDVNKDYELGNCKWSTNVEQQGNRRNSVVISYQGKTQCAGAWAKELGIARNTIHYRLKIGKPINEVLKV